MTLLFSIAGFVLIAATVPLVCELLLLTAASLLPETKPRIAGANTISSLAVVIPAHNEEGTIRACVESLLLSATAEVSVYVVAHNCTDTTAALGEAAGATALIYNDASARGKGHALRHGFSYAVAHGAEAVLVVDADSTVSPNLISEVLYALRHGASAVQCRYDLYPGKARVRSELVALALRAFNLVRPLGRSRLGLSAGILGNGFALSSSTLCAVPYSAFSLVEDLEYHLNLVLADKKVAFIPAAIVSSELPTAKNGETAQHARWQGGRLQAAKTWLPRLTRELMKGRLSILEPVLDLISLPVALGMAAILLTLAIPLAFTRIYAVIALAAVLAYVLRAISLGSNRLRAMALLAQAPLYMIWKLFLIPKVLYASTARAIWVRTERNSTAKGTL
ncbi:MAG TPA: glycosyltransferase family 2 protein [Alloacidobacterium sp.]|nr:glycosyltransferase family 2 protein [Alloacidobacterium sp.]